MSLLVARKWLDWNTIDFQSLYTQVDVVTLFGFFRIGKMKIFKLAFLEYIVETSG